MVWNIIIAALAFLGTSLISVLVYVYQKNEKKRDEERKEILTKMMNQQNETNQIKVNYLSRFEQVNNRIDSLRSENTKMNTKADVKLDNIDKTVTAINTRLNRYDEDVNTFYKEFIPELEDRIVKRIKEG